MRPLFITLAYYTLFGCNSGSFTTDPSGNLIRDSSSSSSSTDQTAEKSERSLPRTPVEYIDGGGISLPVEQGGLVNEGAYLNLCAQKNIKAFETTLVFPSNIGQQCEWGKNGNYVSDSKYISARRVFEQSFTIDTDSKEIVICDFEITMNKNFTRFDDDIVLMYDDAIFATDCLGHQFLSTLGLPKVGAALGYDYSKLSGKKWPAVIPWNASGVDGQIKTTQSSKGERVGSIDLRLTSEFLKQLPASILQGTQHKLSFVLHGNKHATDCQHDGFEFDVRITYLD